MTPDADWQQITHLFDELVEVTDGHRERALLAVAETNARVATEVRTLLHAHRKADGRFDVPVVSRFSSEQLEAISPPDALLRAGRVGAFNIVRKIGEGGMGAVYEATRADATYEQRVAIKTIARGAGSTVIASRFRRERQILAGLQHPNIAVLLDGGVSDNGTPYFVMEYVSGSPIDQWCNTHALGITERLDLMQQVCRAVQHAHQRLVVHRDLKPQNVFVTDDGVVKLLDFGIAKLIEVQGSDGAGTQAVTQEGPSPFTAAYASPEQLRGEPVSTSGDVYSLGVMLYELLAGTRPFPSAGRTPAQLVNDVLAGVSVLPSVACTDEGARLAGEHDRVRLSRKLSGELDAIVMMAMRMEPERRYSSVEALGADIQRYLRGLPVAARADTLQYRARRYVSRNRWLVTMAALLVGVALLSGAAIWRQAMLVRREASRTARIAEFLQSVLGAADVRVTAGVLPRLGPNATVGVLLDSALQHVSTEFPDDPGVRARLYLTIGSSRITQSRMRAASEVLDSAIALSRASQGETSDVYILANLEAGSAAMHRNQLAASEAYTRTAARILATKGDTVGALYARALCDLSTLALVTGAYDSMTVFAGRALALERQRTTAPTITRGIALSRLGISALLNDEWARGDSLFTQSLAVLRAIVPPSNLEVLDVQLKRENVAEHFGRLAQADSIVDAGLLTVNSSLGTDSREHAMFLAQRASIAVLRGNLVLARDASAEALRILDSIPEVLSLVRASMFQTRASITSADRNWVVSDSLLRRGSDELRAIPRGLPVVTIAINRAFVLAHQNRLVAANSEFTRAMHAYDESGIHFESLRTFAHMGRAYMYDRGGDSAAVAREVGLVPQAARAGLRAFLAQQRVLDATGAATVQPRGR